jgi:hypothetical protein
MDSIQSLEDPLLATPATSQALPEGLPQAPQDDAPDEDNGKDRQFVTALARGLEILRCFRPVRRISPIARWPSAPACPSRRFHA